MPRGSSGGGGRSGGRSAPVRRSQPKPAVPAKSAPPAQNEPQSVIGSIGSAIADGIGWGAGSSIGHRAVDAIFGPRTIHVETVESAPAAAVSVSADACSTHFQDFMECLQKNDSNIGRCQFYMDMVTQCKRNSENLINP